VFRLGLVMESAHQRRRQGKPTRTEIRIVLIDDDASDRERVAGIVSSDVAPVVIEEIKDHVSFFQALKRPNFDLVITEQDLHWSSGREVLTAVKSLRPSIPVIMVARSEDEAVAAAALREGLDAYIPKSGELAIRLRSSVRSALQRIEMEERADTLETRIQSLLDRLNVGVFRATVDGEILEANAAFLRLIGVQSPRDAKDFRIDELFVDAAVHRGLLARLEEEGQVRDFQAEIRRTDSSTVWVSVTETIREVAGGDRVVDGLVEDVTLARQAQEAVRRASQDYRAVFEITSAATVILEEDSTISMANTAFERMCGYTRDELEGKLSWAEFVAIADVDRVREQMWALHNDPAASPIAARFDLANREGRTLHVLATLAVLPGARRTVISMLNLTERQRVEEQLLHNAFHDGLTGLPNRLSLLDRMETLLSRDSSDPTGRFALVLLGLDRFRVINDCLGHRVGDLLLQAVTRRLERAVEGADMVARCSGDVFGIILSPVRKTEEAVDVTDVVSSAFGGPFRFGDHEVHCTASFGIVLCDGEGDANDLYRDAEAALYEAKRAGRDRWVVFEPSMFERALHAFTVESDLRSALNNREIHLHYQPIATLAEGEILGFEALVRWRRGGQDLLLPAHFLEVAEDTGLIVPIGREVLRQACDRLQRWLDPGEAPAELFIGVNLSARQLTNRELVAEVQEILDESGVAPANLMFDVDEGALSDEDRRISDTLSQLCELGVQLCVDSFGTGSSLLAILHRFPFETVKIDRAFLAEIGDDQNRWRMVDGIHALALHLGMRVIVEGIEQPAQHRRLLELGCTVGQGDLLSAAVDEEAADTLLRNGAKW
jgi:diguanylate cyclase (GGDEF)-like protein/PAS domain S-box-containing protein